MSQTDTISMHYSTAAKVQGICRKCIVAAWQYNKSNIDTHATQLAAGRHSD